MSKKYFKILLIISSITTAIVLALSAYNYFSFDKPFLNETTTGSLFSFTSMLALYFALFHDKDK